MSRGSARPREARPATSIVIEEDHDPRVAIPATDWAFAPFARSRAERAASGDPRPSLEERYGDHAGYVAAVRAAAARLVAARLLLQADADTVIAQADASSVLR